MANRITLSFIEKIRKYLRDNDLPFINIEDSKNILVLRSAGSYHYLAIQFFDMPQRFNEKSKYFKVKRAFAVDYNQLINDINKYLNATTTDFR